MILPFLEFKIVHFTSKITLIPFAFKRNIDIRFILNLGINKQSLSTAFLCVSLNIIETSPIPLAFKLLIFP